MNIADQVSCEAVESSCDQVTPDSNQDKCLSLMRYKELQQLAMSLNLPGNLKHKLLVDLIKAKRSNREVDVDKIISEHRYTRRLVYKRNREHKNQRPSAAEATSSGVSGRSAATSGKGGAGGLKKRSAEATVPVGPEGSAGPSVSSTPSFATVQVVVTSSDAKKPFSAPVAYPYRYPVQPIPKVPVNRSILANILCNQVTTPALSVEGQLGGKTSNSYGFSSAGPVVSSPQLPHTETESYNKVITTSPFPTNFAALVGKEASCHRVVPQEDYVYSSAHQSSQLSMESIYSPSCITHPSYGSLSSLPTLPNTFINPQQNSSPHQAAYSAGGNVIYMGYQQHSDSSSNENVSRLMGKQPAAQIYGQKSFPNQRYMENGYTDHVVDEMAQKPLSHNHPVPCSLLSSGLAADDPSKFWGATGVASFTSESQDIHKNYPHMSGNLTNVWHYQGLPLNYNESPLNPVVAHDLTVPSRRTSHEASLSSTPYVKRPPTVDQMQASKSEQPDQSQTNPLLPYTHSRADAIPSKTLDVENSSEKPLIQADHQVMQGEKDHANEDAHKPQPLPHGDNHDSSLPCVSSAASVDVCASSEGLGHDSNLGKQPCNSQNHVPETSDCPQDLATNGVQPITYGEDPTLTYWNNICPCAKPNDTSQYTHELNTHFASTYGSVQPNSNAFHFPSSNECDTQKYSHQYNPPQAVGCGYQYSQQTNVHIPNFSYSQYFGGENAETDSTNTHGECSDGYLQEQSVSENFSKSCVSQNSMESMWSSAQASSPDRDNLLATSSPVDDKLVVPQDSCEGGTVFPDEGDLEMEGDQGLSFPNIYDYMVSSADGEGEAVLAAKGGRELVAESDSSPSPEQLCVVEVEDREAKEADQDATNTVEDLSESTCEESDSTRNDSEYMPSPSKDLLHCSSSSSSSESQNSSLGLRLSSSSPLDSSLEDQGTPVVTLKKRPQSTKGKAFQSGSERDGRKKTSHTNLKGSRVSSPKRAIGRQKGVARRDLISCPCNLRECGWVGRIPTLAGHIRFAHREAVVEAEDTSYAVNLKVLNQRGYSVFIQEAGGTLYLVAVHKREQLMYATIQSLPGSTRNGLHLNGTKASLEVLLKDGSSQGWRGRVWSMSAPPTVSSQKESPHSPASLQERLWSRGDYLAVDPSNVSDLQIDCFRLYVSISTSITPSLNPSLTDEDSQTKNVPAPSSPQEVVAPNLEAPSNCDNTLDKQTLPGFKDSFNHSGVDTSVTPCSSEVASEPEATEETVASRPPSSDASRETSSSDSDASETGASGNK